MADPLYGALDQPGKLEYLKNYRDKRFRLGVQYGALTKGGLERFNRAYYKEFATVTNGQAPRDTDVVVNTLESARLQKDEDRKDLADAETWYKTKDDSLKANVADPDNLEALAAVITGKQDKDTVVYGGKVFAPQKLYELPKEEFAKKVHETPGASNESKARLLAAYDDFKENGVSPYRPVDPGFIGDDAGYAFRDVITQTPQGIMGLAGLIGDALERVTGKGASLRDWGYQGFLDWEKKTEPGHKSTFEFDPMMERVKKGDMGALGDFLEYWSGYGVAQFLTLGATTLATGPAGAAVTGAAGPAANVLLPAFLKNAFRKRVNAWIEKQALKKAKGEVITQLAAKEGIRKGTPEGVKRLEQAMQSKAFRDRLTSEEFRKGVVRDIGARIGNVGASAASVAPLQYGSIYATNRRLAEAEGREMTDKEIGRNIFWGTVTTIPDMVGDILGLDLLQGRFASRLPRNRAVAGAAAAGIAMPLESGTEWFQTLGERIGAGQSTNDAEAWSEYRTAMAGAPLGAGPVAFAGGVIHGHPAVNAKAEVAKKEFQSAPEQAIAAKNEAAGSPEVAKALLEVTANDISQRALNSEENATEGQAAEGPSLMSMEGRRVTWKTPDGPVTGVLSAEDGEDYLVITQDDGTMVPTTISADYDTKLATAKDAGIEPAPEMEVAPMVDTNATDTAKESGENAIVTEPAAPQTEAQETPSTEPAAQTEQAATETPAKPTPAPQEAPTSTVNEAEKKTGADLVIAAPTGEATKVEGRGADALFPKTEATAEEASQPTAERKPSASEVAQEPAPAEPEEESSTVQVEGIVADVLFPNRKPDESKAVRIARINAALKKGGLKPYEVNILKKGLADLGYKTPVETKPESAPEAETDAEAMARNLAAIANAPAEDPRVRARMEALQHLNTPDASPAGRRAFNNGGGDIAETAKALAQYMEQETTPEGRAAAKNDLMKIPGVTEIPVAQNVEFSGEAGYVTATGEDQLFKGDRADIVEPGYRFNDTVILPAKAKRTENAATETPTGPQPETSQAGENQAVQPDKRRPSLAQQILSKDFKNWSFTPGARQALIRAVARNDGKGSAVEQPSKTEDVLRIFQEKNEPIELSEGESDVEYNYRTGYTPEQLQSDEQFRFDVQEIRDGLNKLRAAAGMSPLAEMKAEVAAPAAEMAVDPYAGESRWENATRRHLVQKQLLDDALELPATALNKDGRRQVAVTREQMGELVRKRWPDREEVFDQDINGTLDPDTGKITGGEVNAFLARYKPREQSDGTYVLVDGMKPDRRAWRGASTGAQQSSFALPELLLRSAKTVRDAVALFASRPNPFQELARAILRSGHPLTARFEITDDIPGNVPGGYNPATHHVKVHSRAGNRTLFHEVGHSVMERTLQLMAPDLVALESRPAGYRKLIERIAGDSKRDPLIREWARIFMEAAKAEGHLDKIGTTEASGDTYGYRTLSEFTAEAFSNQAFQNRMRAIADPDRRGNLWDSIVEWVRKAFKLPSKTRTLLDSIMQATGETIAADSTLPDRVFDEQGNYLGPVRNAQPPTPDYRLATRAVAYLASNPSQDWKAFEETMGRETDPETVRSFIEAVQAEGYSHAEAHREGQRNRAIRNAWARKLAGQGVSNAEILRTLNEAGLPIPAKDLQGIVDGMTAQAMPDAQVNRSKPNAREVLGLETSANVTGPSRRAATRIRMTRSKIIEAIEGSSDWKDFYDRHEALLLDYFGPDADLFQRLLSATSQAADVKSNVSLALKAYVQLKKNEAFTGFLPAVIGNLNRIRSDITKLSGRKIGNYEAASQGDVSKVVVDRHIARMLFGVISPSAKQFAKAEKVLTAIAQRIGWKPREVQAALWAASIRKSGKEPASYDQYLKRLHDEGTLEQRLGGKLPGRGGNSASTGGRGFTVGRSAEASKAGLGIGTSAHAIPTDTLVALDAEAKVIDAANRVLKPLTDAAGMGLTFDEDVGTQVTPDADGRPLAMNVNPRELAEWDVGTQQAFDEFLERVFREELDHVDGMIGVKSEDIVALIDSMDESEILKVAESYYAAAGAPKRIALVADMMGRVMREPTTAEEERARKDARWQIGSEYLRMIKQKVESGYTTESVMLDIQNGRPRGVLETIKRYLQRLLTRWQTRFQLMRDPALARMIQDMQEVQRMLEGKARAISRGETKFDPESVSADEAEMPTLATSANEIGSPVSRQQRIPFWARGFDWKTGRLKTGRYQAGGKLTAAGPFDIRVFRLKETANNKVSAAARRAEYFAADIKRLMKQHPTVTHDTINTAIGNTDNSLSDQDIVDLENMERTGLRNIQQNFRTAMQGLKTFRAQIKAIHHNYPALTALHRGIKDAEQTRDRAIQDLKNTLALEEGARKQARRDAARIAQAQARASLPTPVREVVQKFSDQLAILQLELWGTGALAPNMRATFAANWDMWLHRSYAIFDTPKWVDWLQGNLGSIPAVIRAAAAATPGANLPENVRIVRAALDRVRVELTRRLAQAGMKKGQSMAQATANAQAHYSDPAHFDEISNYLEDLMKIADGDVRSFLQGSWQGKKPIEHLMERGNIPEEFRELWGEHKNASVNAIKSLSLLAGHLANHQFLTDLRDLGVSEGWISTTRAGKNDNDVVLVTESDANPKWTPLAGCWGPPMLRDALKGSMDSRNLHPAHRALLTLTGAAMAAKTVLYWAGGVRNFGGNIAPAASNNWVRPYEKAWRSDFGNAFKAVYYDIFMRGTKHPTVNSVSAALREDMLELYAYGLADDSNVTGVLKELMGPGILDRELATVEGRLAVAERLSRRTFNWLGKSLKASFQTAAKVYQGFDTVWKFVAFKTEIRQRQEVYGNTKSLDEIKAEAAEAVKKGLPSYSRSTEVIKAIRRVPVTAPFVTFTGAVYNIIAGTFQTGMNDIVTGRETGNKALEEHGIWRLFSFVSTMSLVASLPIMGRMILSALDPDDPFDQDDDDALRQHTPDWEKNAGLIPLGRDKETNEVKYFNLTFSNLYDVVMRPFRSLGRDIRGGAGVTETLRNFAWESLDPLPKEQIFLGAVMDAARGVDARGTTVWTQNQSREEKIAAGLQHIWKAAYEPGTVRSVTDFDKAVRGVVSKQGKAYDVSQTLLAGLLGLKVQSTNVATTLGYAGNAFRLNVRDAAYVFTQKFNSEGTVTDDELRDSYVEANKQFLEAYRKLARKADAARKLLHMSDQDIALNLEAHGVPDAQVANVLANVYPRYEPSKKMLDKARALDAKERKIPQNRLALLNEFRSLVPDYQPILPK